MPFAKSFGISLLAFLVFDFIWLGIVMKDFNFRILADVVRIQDGKFDVLYVPAAFAYLLMALSVALFVFPQINSTDPLWKTFFWGASMGLIIFGVYDLTNLATLKNYPALFVLTDMSWGCVVYGLVTCLNQILVKI